MARVHPVKGRSGCSTRPLNASTASLDRPQVSVRRVGGPQADERAGMLRVQLEGAAEQRDGRGRMLVRQGGEARAVVGVHRELGRVELRMAHHQLPVELLARLVWITLCETD